MGLSRGLEKYRLWCGVLVVGSLWPDNGGQQAVEKGKDQCSHFHVGWFCTVTQRSMFILKNGNSVQKLASRLFPRRLCIPE